MRKSRRCKRRSCGLCKPNKVGWASRWKPRELVKRMEMWREAARMDV